MSDVHQPTFLERLNPTLKFGAFFVWMVVPALFLNPVVPAVFLAVALAAGWMLGGITPLRILRRLRLVAFIAVGLIVFYSLVYGGPGETVLLEWGRLVIRAEGLLFGLGLALRLACFASCSMIFVESTEPSLFVASLICQARLPDRLAYTILAAYRFIPVMSADFASIRAAHRIRGAFDKRGFRAAWTRFRRYGVPLLASGVRHAERLALAMDARGFGLGKQRTHYLQPRVVRCDVLFLLGTAAAIVVLLVALDHFHMLGGFLAGPAEEAGKG